MKFLRRLLRLKPTPTPTPPITQRVAESREVWGADRVPQEGWREVNHQAEHIL